MEKYNDYTAADFLDDNFFILYIRDAEPAVVAQWEQWLQTNPASMPAFNEAQQYLYAVLSAERIRPDDAFESTMLAGIRAGIGAEERRITRIRRIRFWTASAAACLALVAASVWYYRTPVVISTQLGEHRRVELPDHSIITLNANSSLTYYHAWWLRNKREVWLKGEALFEVAHINRDTSHIAPGERFIAYAGPLQVQVLGTTFNIKQRRNEIAVSLIKGKISVTNSRQGNPVLLEQGAAVRLVNDSLITTHVNELTNQPAAWIDSKIIAHGMSVQDIINNYEDTYGYRIVLDNPALAKKTIDGTISIGAEDNLLFMLANILNTDIERNGKLIYLKSR
ncbi:FecR family protein [Filimonas effusa]|uniref:FecR protein domain-containing protein n=1 Tax=Filimonas effusa TaxID=2508721 RepID=A0A4Q1DDA8_9BACT|nr:FecR domain-containing protein [Filimonas effusa]RXK86855.1 hypothetical protein ESB13_08680 [Filimonas effusa]